MPPRPNMSTPTQSTVTSQNNASLNAEGTDPHGQTIITELSRKTKYQVEDDDFVSIVECAGVDIDNPTLNDYPEFMVNELNTSRMKTEIKLASAYKMTDEDRLAAASRHFARWSHYMTHQAPAEVDEDFTQ